MAHNYLPHRDAALLQFVTDLHANLALDNEAFGVTTDQVAQLNTSVQRFASAVALSSNRATRTGVTIEQRDIAKRHLVNGVRTLVRVIQAYPAMTDDRRRMLGITVPDRDRTPVGPPTERPNLRVLSVAGRRVTVRVSGDGGRGRPRGATGANLYSFVGDAAPDGIDAWTAEGGTSRGLISIDLPPGVPPASRVWLTAAWVNAKLQSGLACAPVCTYTNADALSRAA